MRNIILKYTLKIGLLVAIAIISLILIYYKVTSNKEVTIKEDILIHQNKLEEKFLNKTDYSFEEPKVILNPYEISPLTALIIFETKDSATITITVKGKDENTDITNTFTPAKKHIIPIYGLYADTNNEVIIQNGKKKKTVHIQTGKLPQDLVLPTEIEKNEEELNNDLYFVTPSSTGYTTAYDQNGDVRWYLTENFIWDIKRLANGNLLLSTNRLVNPPYYMTGLSEMNLLGKIYYEYSLPGGYHHDVFEMENGNLLVASDHFEDETVEDYIVEIDRKNGEIIKEIDLKKILPIDSGNNIYTTDYDWFHNNSIWYDKNTNSVTLSGRHKDAVININYDTLELNWILGDKSGWDKKYHKYFFERESDETEWQWAQHAAMVLPNGNIFLFDNGNNRSKTEKKAVPAKDNYSRGVIYDINTDSMKINQVWQYGKELGSDFYSPYISDVDYLENNHYIIHSGGTSYKNNEVQNDPAGLTEVDELKSTTVEIKDNEKIFKMTLPTNTYRVEKMSLYADDEFKTGKGVRFGDLGSTEPTTNHSILLFTKKIDKEYKKHNITITKEIDRLVVNGTFKKSDKVEIILDNVFDKKTYNMIISKKPYTALCVDLFNEEEKKNGINVTKYINDKELSGRYYIYIKINKKIYNTKQYVEFR